MRDIDTVRLDNVDREILRILLEDASRSKAEVARAVGLTPTAVFDRLRKLREKGVLKRYTLQIDPRVLGLRLLAFVFVSQSKPVKAGQTGPRLAELPKVEEVHRVAGRDCFLLKVRAADTDDLTQTLDQIGELDSVGAVQTTIVLETFLEQPSKLMG